MVCRVRIRIRHNNNIVETSALVNSGFENDAPDIVIPIEVTKRLGLWPQGSTYNCFRNWWWRNYNNI